MALTAEDRFAINEKIYLHGHLIDAGELDRLEELFTSDVVYDVSDFTGESLVGVGAIRDAALALGQLNPLGHHVTNIVITEESETEVVAHSKGLGVNSDGTSGTVTYEDTVVRTPDGWRITCRKVRARRTPLKS